MYGPNQSTLVILQLIGIILIMINYCINKFYSSNESYYFYEEHQLILFIIYLIFCATTIILFCLTAIIIIKRKQKYIKYTMLKEERTTKL